MLNRARAREFDRAWVGLQRLYRVAYYLQRELRFHDYLLCESVLQPRIAMLRERVKETSQVGGSQNRAEQEWPAETDELVWWSSSCGRIELQMTREQAESASHQGQCDEDVRYLSRVPAIAAQLDTLSPELVAKELREYGAWDEQELADHAQNLQRLLWLAAGDIVDGNN